MPSRTPILKPLTNIPVTGTLTAVYFQPAREVHGTTFTAQLKLRGTWTTAKALIEKVEDACDGLAADLYLPDFLATDLCRDGILRDVGVDRDGNPAFAVQHSAVTIERKEEVVSGKKRTKTVVAAIGTVQTPAPRPVSTAPIPVTTRPGAAKTEGGPGMPKAIPEAVSDGERLWAELEARYRRCAGIAERTYAVPLEQSALVAATATLFIEANRRNLPGMMPAVVAAFAAMPEALTEDVPEQGYVWRE